MRALVAAALLLAACTTTRNTKPSGQAPDVWVKNIRLEPLRGEAGKRFEAAISWQDNYIREPEIEVTGLPPDLVFDPTARKVVGVPRRAGFFTVNVAIRKQVSDEPGHRPAPDERWWPASFQLEIYPPMKE